MVLPYCLKAKDIYLHAYRHCWSCTLSRVWVGKYSKSTDCNSHSVTMWFFSGQSEHVILVLSRKRGDGGESTVHDTDRMESSQQRVEDKLKYLCFVDLWFTFLQLPVSSHWFIHDTHIGVVGGSLIRRFPTFVCLELVLFPCSTFGRENCHQNICNIGP